LLIFFAPLSLLITWSKFKNIFRWIYLVDNTLIIIDKGDIAYDKIAKIMINEASNELCGQFWNAKHNLCVDEMMIKYTEKYSPV
jgi:hypothetical protein